jgi:hypothetical protein
MRRALLWMLMIGVLGGGLTGCGGAASAITAPTFMEVPDTER